MTIAVRPRRSEDLPVLGRVLTEQQPRTAYPLRWPLPIPIEDFLVRPGEERAWVAELDGEVVGHVAVYALDDPMAAAFAAAAFAAAAVTEEIAELAVLFVGTTAIGTGVGGLLHDTAVAWIRSTGRLPVLDVAPAHDRALALYRRRGWREVGEASPPFLADYPPLLLMVLDDPPDAITDRR